MINLERRDHLSHVLIGVGCVAEVAPGNLAQTDELTKVDGHDLLKVAHVVEADVRVARNILTEKDEI
jgi:hypothetical protein